MIKVTTTGLEELIRKLSSISENVTEEVDAVMENIADEFVGRAKLDARPNEDTGFLVGKITKERLGSMRYEISSGSKYAGYLEFGTKKNYVPIPGFEDVAADIRGKGDGTWAEFKDNITQYVQRKGIVITTKDGKELSPAATVRSLMWLIWKNGIHARPYFFKQLPKAQKDLNTDLKAMADQLLK